MNAEERVLRAIEVTRELLLSAFDDPTAMVIMTHLCMNPEDVENQVAMVLEYLDRTREEAGKGG